MENVELNGMDAINCPFCGKKVCKILCISDPDKKPLKTKFKVRCWNCEQQFSPTTIYNGRTNILGADVNIQLSCDDTYIDDEDNETIISIVTAKKVKK